MKITSCCTTTRKCINNDVRYIHLCICSVQGIFSDEYQDDCEDHDDDDDNENDYNDDDD